MKIKAAVLLALLCALAAPSYAHDWVPSGAMLDAVRRVESANGLLTVGDHGQSLGNYQLSEGAWADVNGWRRGRGVPTFDYEKSVWSEQVSRAYAADYLKILHSRLEKHLNRCPSSTEVYAAYNMGLSCFARGQYRVHVSHLAITDRPF